MKRFLLVLMALALLAASVPTWAMEEFPSPGSAMPDFSFTDTDGNTLTLSEVLKEKQVVVISLFASWCIYCDREFPYMQRVYEKYGDQMELMALSAYPMDTMEIMAQYKADRDLTFHFGLTADTGIADVIPTTTYPTNVIIDRFGNIGFIYNTFPSENAFERTVKVFMGDDYNETVVLDNIPSPTMNIPLPDEAELAAALASENIDLTCEIDKTGDVFPFIPETRGDRTAVFASNVGIEASIGYLSASFTSKPGDMLYFEIGTDMPSLNQPLLFILDGTTTKFFSHSRDWTPWGIALEPGEHTAEFVYDVYISDGKTTYVGIDSMSLVSGDEAAELLTFLNDHPVADETSMEPVNMDARPALFTLYGVSLEDYFYVSGEDMARVAIRVSKDIDPETAMITDSVTQEQLSLAELPVENDAYIYEYPNEGYNYAYTDRKEAAYIIFCHGEEVVHDLMRQAADEGVEGIDWCYVNELSDAPAAADKTDEVLPAGTAPAGTESTYTVTVVDQKGDPVPEVGLSFCEDTTCHLAKSDENGIVIFTGKPARYHIQVIDAPDSYDYPEDSDFYTEENTSEITIAITKK